jgi:hypothetical protein
MKVRYAGMCVSERKSAKKKHDVRKINDPLFLGGDMLVVVTCYWLLVAFYTRKSVEGLQQRVAAIKITTVHLYLGREGPDVRFIVIQNCNADTRMAMNKGVVIMQDYTKACILYCMHTAQLRGSL